ncbi:hypothetical protein CPB84DRAFT_1841339 [Gymnopilus junonius]|uniref:Autophagy-related protein 14 n=1 Tax=Gymnopilus junonius TaxID=109634 RepID=A0A9P5TU90_GYMJU|nr:hypothetical protein CPB84DRAFT_1841339 [Gymnopilus junonius]
MPPSAAASESLQPTFEAEHYLTPRRIRHITGVQIRNLTPFPVRDSFTSALSLPLEHSHFSTSDDLASVLSRKRTRKVSTNSTTTRRSSKRDDGVPDIDPRLPVEAKGKAASSSTVAFSNGGNISTSPSSGQSLSYKSNQSLRGRRRTSSVTSFGSFHLAGPMTQSNIPQTALSGSAFLPDHSQAALQTVIDSRLVETYVAISLPSTVSTQVDSVDESLRSAPMKESSSSKFRVKNRPANTLQHEGLSSHPESAPPTRTSFKLSKGNKIESKFNLPSASRLDLASRSGSPSQRRSETTVGTSRELEQVADSELDSPIYFSPIHRPSTNPFFSMDARSGFDFPQVVDTSGQRLRIEIWGRIPLTGKEDFGWRYSSQRQFSEGESQDWKMLEAWDVILSELLPLPESTDVNPSLLASNTLLITLSPPGQVFYLPHPSTTRPSTPLAGYTSDPESEIRRAKHVNEETGNGVVHDEILPLSRRRHRKRLLSTATSTAKTASWQELFKLVTVQSLILDNETSLGEVIHKIDSFLEQDETFHLRRQISERDARIKELEQHNKAVLEECQRKKQEVMDRAEKLKKRNELLALSRLGIERQPVMNSAVDKERNQLNAVQGKITSISTFLLSTLSTIFPIELYSPPDLLFTILDVPLPIPLSPTDPAPPLALSGHKEVTEESVATALGYVAEVLQILAAYLGKNLVYPVTCIGSRSLIRDGISAMVGPRMFPLFSKGVDTYRFEYGVFLLNKNIEMFMSERNLRALDIRHTLPNLKNLLLTLSHDPASNSHSNKPPCSPVYTDLGLKTPSREPSPVREDVSTPKALHIHSNGVEGITPTASGATTPTTTMLDDSRKSKSFLGFVPFGDFLRSRYPSAGQSSDKETVKSSSSMNLKYAECEDAAGKTDADEDDRMTIYNISSDKDGGFQEGESAGGGGPVVNP